MTEQATPPERRPRAESVLDMDYELRILERVRMIGNMSLINVGVDQGSVYTPLEFVGNTEQAIAFFDLVQDSTPPDRLGIILSTNTPGLKTVPELAKRLNESGGILSVIGGSKRDTTIIDVSKDPGGTFHCKFGYSANGTTIEKQPGRGVTVYINTIPESIVDESLYRMYKMTGNPNISEILGFRAEMRGSGVARAVSQAVDPESHYATLGLNPYALRFLSEETFVAMIKGMKRELVKRLHPDVTNPTFTEIEYLKRMLNACDILENEAKRKSYSSWL